MTRTALAWRVHELGEPRDVLRLDRVDVPVPGPGQVLVDVLAAAANFPDVLTCRGAYQVRPELPFVPGVELCGRVVEVGEGVTGTQVGDRVVGSPAAPTGAFAQSALLGSTTTFAAPAGLDDAQAAAFTVGPQTAWFALHHRTQVQPGDVLLVHAAAGGVGSCAVQLGKAAGATVVGVVGSAAKADVARELGADVVVERHAQDFVQVVKDVTDGRGADVVFDPVGGETYQRSTKCIAFEGRIVLVGFAGGQIQTAALNHALIKNYSVVGLHAGLYVQRDPALVRRCHDELAALADRGLAVPLVSERIGLADVPAGLQRLADGQTTGRVVMVA